MSKIINANSSNENILNIYNQIKSGIMKLTPDFQRKLVWNDNHKENFLDTILKGYPFPEIYIADGDIDLDNPTKVEKLIVDGQQRLSTIVQYIDGDQNLKLKKIPYFKELTPKNKEKFYFYTVVIRNLGKLNDSDIKEVFRRINSINYALNAIEITNALYDGEFINTASFILEENKELFERLEIFSINEISRMRDLEFIITLMAMYEEKGYFTTTQRNEFYIKEYNNEYPNKDKITKDFKSTLNIIDKVVEDSYSLWTKKSNFLTLFIELLRFIEGKNIDIIKLSNVLGEFQCDLLNERYNDNPENEFYKYYLSSIQGTGSKTSRITRGKILQEYINANYHSIK